MKSGPQRRYEAVLFDLLTALIDSWTLWNRVAGSEEAGRRWRAEYLELTYGCGDYEPYEKLVAAAAQRTGMRPGAAQALEDEWLSLPPWPEAPGLLASLSGTHRLGIVTNCSERLGRAAAGLFGVSFETVITAEKAGYYKPNPRPYQMALDALRLPAGKVLFVAGSGFDLVGTARVGLDTYWHNRVGLKPPPKAPRPVMESKGLEGVPALALSPA